METPPSSARLVNTIYYDHSSNINNKNINKQTNQDCEIFRIMTTTIELRTGNPIHDGAEIVKFRNLESETEDEEVKMNCIGGFRGGDDSEIFSANSSDDDDDDDDEEGDDDDDDENKLSDDDEQPDRDSRNPGVVTFVKETVRCGLPLVRPQATTPPQKRLSPHDEEDEGSGSDTDSSSSASSVGARGVAWAFSTGTPSAFTDASDASDVSEEEEEEESEDEASEEHPYPKEDDIVESQMDADDNSSASDGESSEDEPEDDNYPGEADEEISSILEALVEQGKSLDPEYPESVESYIGVMEDRDDLITVPKMKRLLSYNTLTALDAEVGHNVGTPKRFKCSPEHEFGQPPILPSLSLGPAALTDVMTPHSMLQHRRGSPIITSSDDEDLDRQLGEELDQQSDDDSREHTPIPLLTPPQSPLTFEVGGETATVCEWPSNLAVDTAMASARELQPLTSEALRDFQNEPKERVVALQRKKQCEPSTLLTPILRGISMGKQ